MTTALTAIAPRLRKLLLMLSSDHDGEVIAGARAIGRALRDSGLDWHHLADTVIRVDRPPDDWRTMAKYCRGQAHRLSPREFDFISNIALSRCEPSPKQLKWLRDIYARLGGEL